MRTSNVAVHDTRVVGVVLALTISSQRLAQAEEPAANWEPGEAIALKPEFAVEALLSADGRVAFAQETRRGWPAGT